ncbi:MAG TPA: hypothetical protein VMT42_01105 [candidate division Zixibacteria bacterium]|nr:hypothetical protein [candidate division Zixibacteria bacterium]
MLHLDGREREPSEGSIERLLRTSAVSVHQEAGLRGSIGIFNPGAPFLSDLNLILQVIILAVLGLAIYARLRHSYMKHAVMMGSAIVLHTFAIFAIMIPSLLSMESSPTGLLKDLLTRFALVTVTHSIIGGLVEIIGVWLVVSWLFNRSSVEKCFRRKNIMRATIALWLAELVLGIFVYMMLYLPT